MQQYHITAFRTLLHILDVGFREPISVNDFSAIIDRLSQYATFPHFRDATLEVPVLKEMGWPETYHPCDHMLNLRKAFCFDCNDNARVEELMMEFDTVAAKLSDKKETRNLTQPELCLHFAGAVFFGLSPPTKSHGN